MAYRLTDIVIYAKRGLTGNPERHYHERWQRAMDVGNCHLHTGGPAPPGAGGPAAPSEPSSSDECGSAPGAEDHNVQGEGPPPPSEMESPPPTIRRAMGKAKAKGKAKAQAKAKGKAKDFHSFLDLCC